MLHRLVPPQRRLQLLHVLWDGRRRPSGRAGQKRIQRVRRRPGRHTTMQAKEQTAPTACRHAQAASLLLQHKGSAASTFQATQAQRPTAAPPQPTAKHAPPMRRGCGQRQPAHGQLPPPAEPPPAALPGRQHSRPSLPRSRQAVPGRPAAVSGGRKCWVTLGWHAGTRACGQTAGWPAALQPHPPLFHACITLKQPQRPAGVKPHLLVRVHSGCLHSITVVHTLLVHGSHLL